MRAPIAVISFNRPAYLEQTLRSLRAQTGGTLHGREVHLFQDGAINAYSRLRYSEDGDVAESIALFREFFPEGVVHFHGDNIGICENFIRAEDHLFLERDFEFAYFFEDDMVLSPVYLDMMERLETFARSSPRVAYFAAYGDVAAPAAEIEMRRRNIANLGMFWGFGLRRDACLRIRRFLAPYYAIVCGSDYARRDHRAIYELFAASGICPPGSSQDAAKAWACDHLGLLRCNTVPPFARYIGRKGVHMTPALFESVGFHRVTVAERPIDDLIFPDKDGVDGLLALQRTLHGDFMRDGYAAIIASLPARELNPMRRCTADDVRAAYRLILQRDPESEEVIEQHVRETAVFSLMQGLMKSREFKNLTERMDHP